MWKDITIEAGRVYALANSYKFYMPEGSEYEGYVFFHPAKLVQSYGNTYTLTVREDWQFKLTKSEKNEAGVWETVGFLYLALDEFEAVMCAVPVLHTPPRLDPLEDVEPLEDLLDE